MKNDRITINDNSYAPRVIFDNGGGVTLQLPGFSHWYNHGEQAAYDYLEYLRNGDTSDWDGNEPDAMECDPTIDQIVNGGYRIWTAGDDFDAGSGWANEVDFFAVLDKRIS